MDRLDDFVRKWRDEQTGRAIWAFERKYPDGLAVIIGDNMSGYRTVHVFVHRDYLAVDDRNKEFFQLLKELYRLLRPMYGNILVREMFRQVGPHPRQRPSGMDLQWGLPDVFWANFLGPEYVEMFGSEKVFSLPCYEAERLHDGGAVFLVSSSPFDCLTDPQGFDQRRLDITRHLGAEAFDTGYDNSPVKVPKFRYEEERKVEEQRRLATPHEKDILARVPRKEWQDWIENNQTIALALVSEM